MSQSICSKSRGSSGNSFANSLIFKYKIRNRLSSLDNLLLSISRGSSVFSYLAKMLLNFRSFAVLALRSFLKASRVFWSSFDQVEYIPPKRITIKANAATDKITAKIAPAICLFKIVNFTPGYCRCQLKRECAI
jgi:hypothetical protein